jgi:riboflavin synthase
MFTGLVKELGIIVDIRQAGGINKIMVKAESISGIVKIGDSVAINGTCLTVTEKKGGMISFDAVNETMKRTTLGMLKSGDAVNLEDSLKAGDPLGGHFVLGHIDCVSRILSVKKSSDNVELDIAIPKESAALVVGKGSIAIDGISLTVGEAGPDKVKLFIIPHTFAVTTLNNKKPGDSVNVEFDVLGKYILRAKSNPPDSRITEEFLRDKGFV